MDALINIPINSAHIMAAKLHTTFATHCIITKRLAVSRLTTLQALDEYRLTREMQAK